MGLASVSVEDASVELNAKTNIVLPGAADGILVGSDFTSKAKATVTNAGSFQAEIPFESQLGTRTHDGVLNISQPIIANANSRTVSVEGAGELKSITSINAFTVLQYLKDLEGVLKNVSDTAELAAKLPFASNLKLNEVADFATALREQVIARIVDANGNPNFNTAQELIDRLLRL